MIPNQWYAVLDSREVPRGKPRAFRRLGLDLVGWRDAQGHVAVAVDRCPHRGAALSLGKVVDGRLQCPFHGFEFRGDGACCLVPASGRASPVPPSLKARTLPAREAHGFIWLWHGAPREVYPELPYFTDLDGFVNSTLRLEWDGVDLTRAVEGLLDLAHLPFVHRRTIGAGQQTVVNGPRAVLDGDQVSVWFDSARDTGVPARRAEELPAPSGPPPLEFRFPNLWRLRLSEKFRNVIALAPVEDGKTVLYVRSCQRVVTAPVLGHAVAWFLNLLNAYIAQEDYQVIRSQQPCKTPEGPEEHLVPADKPIALYLRRRRELRHPATVPTTPEAAVPLVLRHPDGAVSQVVQQPGQTILEAALAAGVHVPHSCRAGSCGTCLSTRVSGDLVMEEPTCLTAEERANGAVLPCVARAINKVELKIPD